MPELLPKPSDIVNPGSEARLAIKQVEGKMGEAVGAQAL
jgi:hypothetical protein